LEDARVEDLVWGRYFQQTSRGLILPASSFPKKRISFARWALSYLEGIQTREPQYGCFGLHEWAMVYNEPNVRHTKTPLRLHPEQIVRAVDAEVMCCTHYDAFRFFTLDAVPKNVHRLDRSTTDRFDQRGCVHVNMDLYRYAYKIAPWVAGELMADAFELAWEARQLDMRASPYDMRPYGLQPIAIETANGKLAYVAEQKRLAQLGEPIRLRLIETYRKLNRAKTEV
jgi:hypothetical protein